MYWHGRPPFATAEVAAADMYVSDSLAVRTATRAMECAAANGRFRSRFAATGARRWTPDSSLTGSPNAMQAFANLRVCAMLRVAAVSPNGSFNAFAL